MKQQQEMKAWWRGAIVTMVALMGCAEEEPFYTEDWTTHGEMAAGIYAPLGEVIPTATPEQAAVFEEGEAVSLHRFAPSEGLGPAFNVTFCTSCHEKPTTGGGAGMYRNFAIGGTTLDDGSFVPAASAGDAAGVIRRYLYDHDGGLPEHPELDDKINTIGVRNPIPFYGVGLLAEIADEEILKRVDENDRNGDGISGRANYDRGFVGRFGRKSQTVSIEGFIRGPLFNHLGITTNPLSDERRAQLPVDSSSGTIGALDEALRPLQQFAQAAAPDGPLTDDDGVADPEMSEDELFALVSYAMLLAAPQPEPLNEQTTRGRDHFNDSGCASCHTPRLESPRGALPVYSDLLLHDMGPELADGLTARLATGSEFRTQPLWGIGVVGPYLHDGRAETLEEAIAWHGGEAAASRDAALALKPDEMDDLIEFLRSLGGRAQYTRGMLPPNQDAPAVGEYGGPVEGLTAEQHAIYEEGRVLFDAEFGLGSGLGAPRFNGDSCRACHFEPVMGGSGPLGVNVIRYGIENEGTFEEPVGGTILHHMTSVLDSVNDSGKSTNMVEMRNTPHLFGLGLIDSIPEEVILANADPDDTVTPDGISGRAAWVPGDRLGRYGWKAQVPTIEEFVRDAVTAEMGMTLPPVDGMTYGILEDNDDIPDPEYLPEDMVLLGTFLHYLGPPPRSGDVNAPEVLRGEEVFGLVGCDGCHKNLESPNGEVPLYSDLLLHDVMNPQHGGIPEFEATSHELRTAPLWGLSKTGPYLHNGRAETIEDAIMGHYGEASETVNHFQNLSDEDRNALLAFLHTL